MGVLTCVGKVFKVITGPLGILEDWAKEPLKRWENERKQSNCNREVERIIRQQTGVETVKYQLKKEEAEYNASLQIRMQTEIVRINSETDQWVKDQEFQRMKDVAEAVTRYRERLTQLQYGIIKAIGDMQIDLREKAQDLILAKTREYKALQDLAQKDAEAEFERILDKFSSNERIMDIMITSVQKKLASVIDSTSQFLVGLNEDILNMNRNIDAITQKGQDFIDKQIENQYGQTLPNNNIKQIQ